MWGGSNVSPRRPPAGKPGQQNREQACNKYAVESASAADRCDERARCQVRCDEFNHGPTFYRNFLHEIGGPPPKSTSTKRKRAICQSKAFFLVLTKAAAASHPRRVVVEGGGARPERKAALVTEPTCPCREMPSCPVAASHTRAVWSSEAVTMGEGGGRHPASVSAQGRDLLPRRVPHPRHVVVGGSSSGARLLHERALAIRETALGPEHPDTATSLDNLASRWIAGPWIRSALPMSGANRPGPGRGRAEPLNLAGVQHGRERAIPSSYRACSTCSRNRM